VCAARNGKHHCFPAVNSMIERRMLGAVVAVYTQFMARCAVIVAVCGVALALSHRQRSV
jgi:hypothetical protein